jgi:hypothetical protein
MRSVGRASARARNVFINVCVCVRAREREVGEKLREIDRDKCLFESEEREISELDREGGE